MDSKSFGDTHYIKNFKKKLIAATNHAAIIQLLEKELMDIVTEQTSKTQKLQTIQDTLRILGKRNELSQISTDDLNPEKDSLNLKLEIGSLLKKQEELAQKIEDQAKEIQSLKTEREQIESELGKSNEENQALNSEKAELEKALTALNNEFDSLRFIHSRLLADFDCSEKAAKDVKACNNNLRSKMIELEKVNENLKVRIIRLEEDLLENREIFSGFNKKNSLLSKKVRVLSFNIRI